MRQHEPVDLKKFAEYLEKNPTVYPSYRSLKKGDKPWTIEQLEQARRNNLAWAEKIRKQLGGSE